MKFLLNGQESDRLFFRKVDRADFNNWLPFHSDAKTSAHWVSEKEDPVTACQKWYDKQLYRYQNNLGGMNALIEKSTGALVGHCGLLVQTVDGITELEIGYSLLPDFWNKGYATEAAKKCRDFAFENNFTHSLISIISLTNLPSGNVARKIGMIAGHITTYNGNRVTIFRITKQQWQNTATP